MPRAMRARPWLGEKEALASSSRTPARNEARPCTPCGCAALDTAVAPAPAPPGMAFETDRRGTGKADRLAVLRADSGGGVGGGSGRWWTGTNRVHDRHRQHQPRRTSSCKAPNHTRTGGEAKHNACMHVHHHKLVNTHATHTHTQRKRLWEREQTVVRCAYRRMKSDAGQGNEARHELLRVECSGWLQMDGSTIPSTMSNAQQLDASVGHHGTFRK